MRSDKTISFTKKVFIIIILLLLIIFIEYYNNQKQPISNNTHSEAILNTSTVIIATSQTIISYVSPTTLVQKHTLPPTNSIVLTPTPSFPDQRLCNRIKQLGGYEALDNAQGNIRFYGWTSYWQRGSIPSQMAPEDRACALVYIVAIRPWDDKIEWMSKEFDDFLATTPSRSGRPSIQFLAVDEWPLYDSFYRNWLCPREIGALTITSITPGVGFEGIITFISLSGVTGTFNMANEEWHFNE